MTNLSPDEQSKLDAALARIVDKDGNGGTDADWHLIIEVQGRLGKDFIRKASEDAVLKLKRSRV